MEKPDGVTQYSMDAEKAVLRAVLGSSDAVADIVEILHPDDFYRPAHGLIYTTILDLYSRNEPHDHIAVAAELVKHEQLERAGGDEYLRAVAGGSSKRSDTWMRQAERVQAFAVLRRTREAAVHIEDMAVGGDAENIDQLADAAQAEIFAATVRCRTGLPPSYALGDILEGLLDEFDAGGQTGVPTGFTDLDLLTGGLHPGQLIVIAARPAMGKSTFVLNLLRNAAIKNNLAAALFTLELERLDISRRIMSAEARVALHHMRAGILTDDDWTRLARRMPDVSTAPLFIQDTAYRTFTDLRAHCRRLHAQQRLRLIAVDALHLLNYGTRQLGSRYEEISEISRCLKLLAKELQIPIIAVSTLNRAAEQRVDKKPMMNDLRDSGALEDNADIVILIHREDAYERDSPRAGEADLIVAKHRDGPTATITVAYQGHYSRFVDMATA
ncbi:replicative DNA helicase [Streptomyces sp. ASQP_92]|uniref:replicative DNA helicase n=1 Tax=Streptomyces sp. ASQP_92 TaxID=2979116 RepID=UPI0021C18C15|nr:replicative DNA helicase [Streptomyces sp. ASQP_92]MCT9093922.1 replicative DNA helicase [Streptomyces sp. ASQP_92]